MTSPDLLENFHSFFASSFPLAKESKIFSWQLLQFFSPAIFGFQSRVVWLFCKNKQKLTTTKRCFDILDI